MNSSFLLALALQAAIFAGQGGTAQSPAAGANPAQSTQQDAQSTKKAGNETAAVGAPAGTPRGRKLVLKDGTYQLVRDYEQNGERVRYYSIERAAWEEIPASMVDWDATKKAEASGEKTDEALVQKVHVQEQAMHADMPLDVDASLTVAQGVFLPDGEGMFALDGKSLKALAQAGSQVKTDKKTVLKQVFTPIPIIASKKNVEIPGTRAAVRVTTPTPEFYLREPPPDPEKTSTVLRTGRQDESGPDVALVKVTVKGNKRLLESVRSYFGEKIGEERQEVSMQRWEVAPDVYRFTLSTPLAPGEYALAEILQDGLNLYVWDFGVDAAGEVKPAAH
jgi:hypothetical protein